MKTIKTSFKFLTLLFVLASLAVACDGEDGMDGAMGIQGIQGEQGPIGPQGEPGQDGTTPRPKYTVSSNLNTSPVNASNDFSPIGPAIAFDKESDDSIIEVVMNSNCYSGVFGAGARAVRFEIRINGTTGMYGNNAVIRITDTQDFLSILEVFDGLPAGTHTAQVFVRAVFGTSENVVLDPGGFGGRVIVKEFF